MKKIVLALSACFIAITMMSQISFGPKLGLNLSKYAYDWSDDWDEPQVKLRFGGSIGGMMNLQINEWLAFQPSLSFIKKGTSYDVESWNSGQYVYTGYVRDRISYIELPLNLAAGIRLGSGQIQLFVGPYIAFAIAGVSRWNYEENDNGIRTDFKDSEKIKFKNEVPEEHDGDEDIAFYQRPLDYGFNVGFGYRYNQYLFNLGYAMGLANLQPDRSVEGFDAKDAKYSNRTVFFTVAWLFGDE